MRAVTVHQFGGLDGVRLESQPDPQPQDDQVLVEIAAAPVNYVDLLTLRGEYQFKPALPYIPGKGPAGVVRAVGAGISGFQAGDRVLAMAEYGGYAELVAVDHRQVHPLPEGVTFREAAAMSLAYDTAWMALRDRARLRPGESVLVLGASGAVGQAAVQLARAMGASAVLGAVSRPERLHGEFDAVIDLSQPDLKQSVRDQVWAATDGGGVDVVIDPLGAEAFDGAVRSLAWRGRIVIVGFAAGRIPSLKMNYPLLKNIEISGLQISDYRKRAPELVSECYREVFRWRGQGRVTPPDSECLPLGEWRSALHKLATRAARGRILLQP
jgi:NADPH:quinone reductase